MVLNVTVFFSFFTAATCKLNYTKLHVYVFLPVCSTSCNVLIMSSECERLQTRRQHQFFGVGLMVFSQPLTGKISFVYLFASSRQCSFLLTRKSWKYTTLTSVYFYTDFSVFPNKNE